MTSFLIPWYHVKSCLITFYSKLLPIFNRDLFRTLKSPHPFEFIVWWRHSLSRAIRPIPALSLFILSYYPSYNQDLFRTLKSPHPFEFIVWWRHSLSRAITPNPALSLFILSYYPSYNQDFFRTLKSPHPFELILWWRHSLSRAITQNPALSLFILAITHLKTKIFQNSKITPPLWIIFDDVIPYPVLSGQFLPYHFLSV